MLALISIIWLRKLLVAGEYIKTHWCPVHGLRVGSLLPTPCLVLRLHQPSKGRFAWSHPHWPQHAGEALICLWSGGHWPTLGLWGLMKSHLLPAHFTALEKETGIWILPLYAGICQEMWKPLLGFLQFPSFPNLLFVRWGQTLCSVIPKCNTQNKSCWILDHHTSPLRPHNVPQSPVSGNTRSSEKTISSFAISTVFLAFSVLNSIYVLRVTLSSQYAQHALTNSSVRSCHLEKYALVHGAAHPASFSLQAGPWTFILRHCRDLYLLNAVYKIKGLLWVTSSI